MSSSVKQAPELHALMTQQLLLQMLQCYARIGVSDAPCDASSPVESFAIEVTAVPTADLRKCA
jgi:hypothetical protein